MAEAELQLTHAGATRITREVALKAGPQQELQIAWAEVYVPNDIDTANEWMSEETVRKLAHGFIRRLIEKGSLGIDVDHDQKVGRAYVVESFIARDGDPDFTPGAWVLGVKFTDPQLWQSVKRGERASLSFQAWVRKQPTLVELDDAREVTLKTHAAQAHSHAAHVELDEYGNVLKGVTDVVDGHRHRITENVRTEVAGNPPHHHLYNVPRRARVAA